VLVVSLVPYKPNRHDPYMQAPALTSVRAGALLRAGPDYGVCVIKLTARLETTKFVAVESTVSTWL
jgi:hypothetical protein